MHDDEPGRRRCGHCGSECTVRNGSAHGQRRWKCRACQRTFGERTGTPMAQLHTEAAEVAQALLIVMRRGSLRAAEEITGHKYETISRWLQKALAHAEAVTAVLVHDLSLSEVEVDEFWSFVERKAAGSKRGRQPAVKQASDGGATAWTEPAAS